MLSNRYSLQDLKSVLRYRIPERDIYRPIYLFSSTVLQGLFNSRANDVVGYRASGHPG